MLLEFWYSVERNIFVKVGFATQKLFQECLFVAQFNVVPGNYFKLLAKEQPEISYVIINNYNVIINYNYDYLTLWSTHVLFMCFPPCGLIILIISVCMHLAPIKMEFQIYSQADQKLFCIFGGHLSGNGLAFFTFLCWWAWTLCSVFFPDLWQKPLSLLSAFWALLVMA